MIRLDTSSQATQLQERIKHLQLHLAQQLATGHDQETSIRLFKDDVEGVTKIFDDLDKWATQKDATADTTTSQRLYSSVPTVMVSTMVLEDQSNRLFSTSSVLSSLVRFTFRVFFF